MNIASNFGGFSESALILKKKREDFDSAIPRFESWRPSGPLSPLLPVSGLLENERLFRALDWRKRVSGAKHLALWGSQCAFLHASLWSRFFNIQILLLKTRFESTETGSKSSSADVKQEQQRCPFLRAWNADIDLNGTKVAS
jgi:hypothetical protein